MKMPMFSEPQLCLLSKWTDARLLEDSMIEVREKYTSIIERALDAVQKRHSELDSRELHLKNDGVNAGLGKKSWLTKSNWFISGFWLGEIRLDDLTSDDEDAPDKTVWVNHPDCEIDIDDAEKTLRAAAASILTKNELSEMESNWGKGIAGITYPIRTPRRELFHLLIKDDARAFVSLLVDEFESMTKFTSIIDEIYSGGKQRRKK
jgi:hypothetical protein